MSPCLERAVSFYIAMSPSDNAVSTDDGRDSYGECWIEYGVLHYSRPSTVRDNVEPVGLGLTGLL